MEKPATAPTPELIFNTFNAYQRTAALKSAVELDLFTAIGEGFTTAKALAERCQASERGVRILCDYLVINGLLTKNGNRYGLTPDSATFLDRRSPACMAGAAKFLTSPMLMDNFKDLTATIRRGGSAIRADGSFGEGNAAWVEFARSMVPIVIGAAGDMVELLGDPDGAKWKVLDIAAGHGMFGITVAKRRPNAEIVAVDWPEVLTVARENAEANGVASRYRTIPGSAFEVEFGNGYDVVLLTNILHHFDVSTCEALVRKVHAALKAGGRVATLEFVPNEDRVSPPTSASFSLMMLGGTPAGDAYTFSELDGMFRRAGFARNDLHQATKSPQQIIISYK